MGIVATPPPRRSLGSTGLPTSPLGLVCLDNHPAAAIESAPPDTTLDPVGPGTLEVYEDANQSLLQMEGVGPKMGVLPLPRKSERLARCSVEHMLDKAIARKVALRDGCVGTLCLGTDLALARRGWSESLRMSTP